MKNIPTLYEWAGDMKTFETLFSKFYDKVLKDDLLGMISVADKKVEGLHVIAAVPILIV